MERNTEGSICDVASQCGGCPHIQTPHEQRRLLTLRRVRRLLSASGVPIPSVDWVEADATSGYRNRVRVRLGADNWTYFNPHKSRRCPVLEKGLRRSLSELGREWPSAELQSGLASDSLNGEVRAPDADGHPGLYIRQNAGRSAAETIARIFRRRLGASWLVAVEDMPDADWPMQRQWLRSKVFGFFPLGCFQQINTVVNRLLVAHLVDGAMTRGCQTFLDLFAGSGNFALPLAAAGLRGSAVEVASLSVAACQRAAAQQGLHELECHAGSVTGKIDKLGTIDLVVADPPRAGLRDGVDRIASRARRHVALCSCNPKTLSADLVQFCSLGFEIEQVTAFDMFPHTDHIELMVWLRAQR